jgi:hypothetical protein
MNAGLFWLLVLLVIGIAIAAAIMLPAINLRTERLSRKERKELASLRDTVDVIDALAYENRDVNPELSVQILDEIKKHRRGLSQERRALV